MSHDYYVYLLLDPRHDNLPFYVGKGKKDRAKAHLYETEDTTENIRKVRKIKSIRKAGLEPIIYYHTVELEEDAAYALESALIKKYGRAKIDEGGILTNICVDNRPPVRYGPHPEEIRKKIGDAQRGELNHRYGVPWSEEEKQQRSEFNKANGIRPPVRSGPMSAEQKAAISLGNKGKKRSAEICAHFSSIRKGKKHGPFSEENRRNIGAAIIRANGGEPLPQDLTGMTIGDWVVLAKGTDRRDANHRGAKNIFWLCRSLITALERELSQQTLQKNYRVKAAQQVN